MNRMQGPADASRQDAPVEPGGEPRKRSWPRRLLNKMEVDRATFFALAARGWQFLAGPVTLVLIAQYFSKAVQGYFYTFASLLALQSFLELGFQVAITNVTSHEWAKLRLDEQGRIRGDAQARSRLVSLGRLAGWWYSIGTAVFIIGIGLAGIIFFTLKPAPGVAWLAPWIALVVLSGLLFWTLPFVAILEGCNQVSVVNRYRLVQATTGNLVVWVCIPLGFGLWTAVASAAVRLFWELYLLLVHYRPFFEAFWSRPAGPSIQWRSEVWPLQWRLAVQGLFTYFALWLYTPVMFQAHSAEVAGQMGMTWTVLTTLQMAAVSWVQTRVPLFGMLVSRRDFVELDRVFHRLTAIAATFLIAGGFFFWSLIYWINALEHPFAERFLGPREVFLFTLALLGQLLSQCLSFYIRAHKHDPLMWGSVITAVTIGIAVCYLGARFGPVGAAVGLLVPVLIIGLPFRIFVWHYCRQTWHQANDEIPDDV